MGDLATDAAVTRTSRGEHTFQAELSRDWEIWGPNGGYLTAIALRAAALTCQRARPANASVHFLGVASFDAPLDIDATVQRSTRQAASVHVTLHQNGKPVLAAMIWALDAGIEGLEHDDAVAPDTPNWRALPTIAELQAADPDAQPSRYRFWDNFEQRPVTWMSGRAWAERSPGPAGYLNWMRFTGRGSQDAWGRAEELALLVDLGGWPAVGRRHVDDRWMAPSIDVSCEFHRLDTDDEWYLLDGSSAIAADGLIATHQRVWNERGRLLASGRSHLLSRRIG